MFKYFFIFILFYSFNGSCQKNSKYILWSSKKLEWTDFKGKVTKQDKYAVAMVVYYVDYFVFYKNDSTALIEVKACFNKQKAWVSSVEGNTEYGLNHEQRHFDIAEIYSRKLRKLISELQILDDKFVCFLETKYKEYLKQLKVEQEKYDNETNHSLDKAKQKEWDISIDKQLEELSSFKEISVTRIIPQGKMKK